MVQETTLTPRLCRAARAGLGLTQAELAEAAGVFPRTLEDFERGHRAMQKANQDKVRAELERRGVTFPDANCICLPAE
jgi:transcriptional regulator with XRE-family HTH domain